MNFRAPNVKRPEPLKKYRSPDSTPVHCDVHTSQQPPTFRDPSFKLVSNCSHSAQKELEDQENHGNPQEMDHLILRYQQGIPVQTIKIQELKKVLEQYDENTAQNDSGANRIEERIASVHNENQQLLELLKERELDIQNRVQRESEGLAETIAGCDREARQIGICLEHSKQKHSKLKTQYAKHKELELEDCKNQKLRAEVLRTEREVEQYTSGGMSREEYKLLKTQMKELHLTELSLAQQNTNLKHELAKQRKTNADKAEGPQSLKLATEEINRALCEVSTIGRLVDSYQSAEPMQITEFLSVLSPPAEPLPVVLKLLKSQVCALKSKLSDVYAEQCGSTCISQ